MAEEEAQSTFDWMADDNQMEVVEGIKFDPEREYPFEIKEITGKGGIKEGKPWKAIVVAFAEEESGVVIRKMFFISDKITKNVDSPEKSNDLVKLAEVLGHKPEIGKKIHPKNFLRVGMKVTAHVLPQKRKDGTETGYSEISIASIKPLGKKAQQTVPVNTESIGKWQKEISDGKYSTKEKFMQNLAGTGRVNDIAEFLAACESGSITFA